MLEENDLQKLLRLKRHEQPPPGYFDDFLREFQQRQRDEMLRLPAWQVALDRLGAFVGRISLPQLAYHGATVAIILTAGAVSWKIMASDPAGGTLARASVPAPAVASADPASRKAAPLLDDKFFSDRWVSAQREVADTGSRTHYVIDARPVSYEPAFSF